MAQAAGGACWGAGAMGRGGDGTGRVWGSTHAGMYMGGVCAGRLLLTVVAAQLHRCESHPVHTPPHPRAHSRCTR